VSTGHAAQVWSASPCPPVLGRVLVVALCAAISLVVALLAGILARADGVSMPAAVQRGGAAFAGGTRNRDATRSRISVV
jgi:hypothetical protein